MIIDYLFVVQIIVSNRIEKGIYAPNCDYYTDVDA